MRGYFLAVVALVGAVVLSAIYTRFRMAMFAAREIVRAGSDLLRIEPGDIEYAVSGEGRPVLLLHGAGGGYDQGLLLGRTILGDGFQLISVSRFGYLRSPIPKDSSLEAQASFYVALLDHLEIEKVIVVGGSAGGPSALRFAHDYPERCAALILGSAISMSIATDKNALNNKIIHTIQRADFVFWILTKFFRSQFLHLIGVPPEVYQGLTPAEKTLAQKMLDTMHPMSLRRAGSMHEFNIRPLDSRSMHDITVPTLIFHARDDMLVNYKHAEFAHNNIEQSVLVSFDSGGHGMLSQIASLREQVRIFLKSVQ